MAKQTSGAGNCQQHAHYRKQRGKAGADAQTPVARALGAQATCIKTIGYLHSDLSSRVSPLRPEDTQVVPGTEAIAANDRLLRMSGRLPAHRRSIRSDLWSRRGWRSCQP